ncbi:hypothetical protein KO527_23255 [Pseudoalteromonas sp. C2R02]|nr:DUF6795 domain-containing protein [Pseudoalteromonas sp. C2R02]MBU2972258.1 hypothetical protein [Pseudoalteromonas sp. C2R02]
MNHGKPLINATITRTLSYSDGKYSEDMCNTDNDGYFSMPEKSLRSSQTALLIAERFTSQRIYAHYYGDEYLLWSSQNSGIVLKPEYTIKLQSLYGDIEDDEIYFSFRNERSVRFKASSICRWQDDFTIIDPEAEFLRMCQGALEE